MATTTPPDAPTPTISRPEWTTIIDPVLQQELERHVLVTSWDKLLGMVDCASGGGPFKEGYNVVSGIDKYLPVDVYIPGCPPTPQGLLNGLITLQKKIDGERIDIPALGKHGNTPWYK